MLRRLVRQVMPDEVLSLSAKQHDLEKRCAARVLRTRSVGVLSAEYSGYFSTVLLIVLNDSTA